MPLIIKKIYSNAKHLFWLICGKICIVLFYMGMCRNVYGGSLNKILIAKGRKSFVDIIQPYDSSEISRFAAQELSSYLHKISGAYFSIQSISNGLLPHIIIKKNKSLATEDYIISTESGNIVLSGGSDRAILYSVYNFLHSLGCEWFAPDLAIYNGSGEHIPRKSILFYHYTKDIYEHPVFAYRKLDVEEGRTHNAANLRKIIEWMPKVRYNILMVPLNYGGSNRVKWDNWTKELTPELKKRGLMIEVGGHGYQNYLNAGMENGTLFKEHPDWFGKDKNCMPSPQQNLVFNTSNKDAVRYLINNVIKYIEQHPEINIFDFWPPDGARWNDCPQLTEKGSPVERQAKLVNEVDSAIKKVRPDLLLEMIAYQPVLMPPEKVQLNKNILVDFCPINQSFEKQIYDSGSLNNYSYQQALKLWRQTFKGDIGLYSYYRKYAWHSLPNVIPHYIQRDLQWYSNLPLQGISTYAEPGDWFTYELNHYILGHLCWNVAINVDSLINQYCIFRYGRFNKIARSAYSVLENVVPDYCSIPFSNLKPVSRITEAKSEVLVQIHALQKVQVKCDGDVKENFSRLLLMMQYVYYDLEIQQLISASENTAIIEGKIKELLKFMNDNKDKGVFIISSKNELSWMSNHYKMDKR
jgi:hypothetical protein